MAKFLRNRGSSVATKIISAGGSNIRVPRSGYQIPTPVWYATLDGTLDSTTGSGTFTRSGEGSYTAGGEIKYAATDVPRYQDGGIIIEPESTNYVQQNLRMGNVAPWVPGFSGGYDPESIEAPDGSTTALELWAIDAFSATTQLTMDTVATISAADPVSVSFYAKSLGTNVNPYVRVNYRDQAAINSFVYFDVTTGQLANTDPGAGVTISDVTITPGPNGFTRYAFTLNETGASQDAVITFAISNSSTALTSTASTQGNGTVLWGAQVEQQPWASLFIRNTTSANISRGQDFPKLTGMPAGYPRTLGALSLSVTALAPSAQSADSPRLYWGADVNLSYLLLGNDGGTFDGYQSNAGAGGDSLVTRVAASLNQDDICITFDASGDPTFPGTKRFAYIAGVKHERGNNTGNNDTFVEWPLATENWLGQMLFGSSAAPAIIKNLGWWNELSENEATALSLGYTP